ncbi:MAG: hypothetical protein OEL69_07150 [Nitrosopumilus sp.]|nr:hypothetical protein [Nitrosopumilus sp.]
MSVYFDFMQYLLLFVLILLPTSAFAESLENIKIENPSEYVLSVDDHIYSIQYQVDAHVLAMTIDPELTSLLIGLEDSKNSIFEINLEHEIINAENNEFVVLVNGYDVDYDIIADSDSFTLSFYIPEFTEEVEIVGTHVIPEFPIGTIMVFMLLVSAVTIFSRVKTDFRL